MIESNTETSKQILENDNNNKQEEEKTMNAQITKLGGYEFFKQVLKSPRHVVAPMVDHTYLAFRLLTRKYGAHLVYTPMFHSKNFATDATYRRDNFETHPADRPLIVQFCGNEVDYIVKAAKMVEDRCDAVDINLGCPQGIAKRGNYGAFLLEKPDIVLPMVRALHKELKVPVFCKIRLLPNIQDTIKLALQLQEAGCQLLTIHGRTKEQKGQLLVPANWDAIREIKKHLTIPVIANGSVDTFDCIDPCLKTTEADGVMTAEGILANPAMFAGNPNLKLTDVCRDYLDICESTVPTPFFVIRSHCYKMLKHYIDDYEDIRDQLSKTDLVPDFRKILDEIDRRVRENVPKVRMLTNKEKRELKRKADEEEAAKLLQQQQQQPQQTDQTTTAIENPIDILESHSKEQKSV